MGSVAVIGGTAGIGQAMSRALAAQGRHVLVVGRTFRDADVPGLEFVRADLSSMREAARLAGELPTALDAVVFTTGIIAAPQRQETAEGIEADMAVSYLSRFVILRGLADRLERGKVFVMGFPGKGQAGYPTDLNAERSYKAMAVHMNTVAANEALVLDAARRYPHLDVFGLNPGFVKSGIRSNLFGEGSWRYRLMEAALAPIYTKPSVYADRVLPLLSTDAPSGTMFNRKGAAIPASPVLTPDRVTAFMAASERLVAKTGITVP
ncbi:SDR family NAD(P)-dependent oxidoreductase [Actinoplanes sp. TRM 88003]|uniref:SDR family NAD(P)-dependent oxidoreductase n=1 Tax=Paractinoplanes aksuensis TaxID=2939490 RepID=A0ABT1DEL3_9ACTN|nr:SDR family NAD(P)-dependent oxidoreductase [Actinoplanes aksuensis]MCO8269253.1 SDR family NAD(P)-dependent oxidoreductase [Actinoplanes aksuensis]